MAIEDLEGWPPGARDRPTRHGDPIASARFPSVLVVEVVSEDGGAAKGRIRVARARQNPPCSTFQTRLTEITDGIHRNCDSFGGKEYGVNARNRCASSFESWPRSSDNNSNNHGFVAIHGQKERSGNRCEQHRHSNFGQVETRVRLAYNNRKRGWHRCRQAKGGRNAGWGKVAFSITSIEVG